MPAVDWVLLVLGTALGILSLTADLVGLGGYQGFGWRQALGTVVALIVVGVAATRIFRRDREVGP
jgi:hypothetical protein